MARPNTIKIGILHSVSGPMALNETSLRDVILMEVDRVNQILRVRLRLLQTLN